MVEGASEAEKEAHPLDENGHPYVGLLNQASTCYLNSALQTLYLTPEFRNALYRLELCELDAGRAGRSICFQLQRLFLLLQTSGERALPTTALTASFGWEPSESYYQHDVQELCRLMLEALERAFRHGSHMDHISHLYRGSLVDFVRCLRCGTEKQREEEFTDLALAVRPFGATKAHASLREALDAFVEEERLEGPNQYSCEACAQKCDAQKGLRIVRFPYLLQVQLKRFDFDYTTLTRIKLNDRMSFPEVLNLNSYLNEKSEEGGREEGGGREEEVGSSAEDVAAALDEGPAVYRLFSIMVHAGSALGGHYRAYIRNLDTGEWLSFDDEDVRVGDSEALRRTFGGPAPPTTTPSYFVSSNSNAYMLTYRQVDPERNEGFHKSADLPPHLQRLLARLETEAAEERRAKELQNAQCTVRIFHRKGADWEHLELRVFKDLPIPSLHQAVRERIDQEGISIPPPHLTRLVEAEPNGSGICLGRSLDAGEFAEAETFKTLPWHNAVFLEARPPGLPARHYSNTGTTVRVNMAAVNGDEEWILGESELLLWVPPDATVGSIQRLILEEQKGEQLPDMTDCDLRLVLPKDNGKTLRFLDNTEVQLRSELGYQFASVRLYADASESESVMADRKLPFERSSFRRLLERRLNARQFLIGLPSTGEWSKAGYAVDREGLESALRLALVGGRRQLRQSLTPVPSAANLPALVEEEETLDLDFEPLSFTARPLADDPERLCLLVKVDQRMRLSVLKTTLCRLLRPLTGGLTESGFGIAKLISLPTQATSLIFDIRDENDCLSDCTGMDALLLKLGRPLGVDEFQLPVFKFALDQPQSEWAEMFSIYGRQDSRVADLLQEAETQLQSQCCLHIPVERLRLRAIYTGALPVLQPEQTLGQLLSRPLKLALQILDEERVEGRVWVFVRRWSPRDLALHALEEVAAASFQDLRQWLARRYRIPPESCGVTGPSPVAAFPYELERVSLLDSLAFHADDGEWQAEWEEEWGSVAGRLLYFRDLRESPPMLSEEEKKAMIIKDSQVRRRAANSQASRKERTLKIRTERSMSIAD